MKNRRRHREIYPGVDNRFVICDVCGKKFRVKDTVRIVDRYNLLNNMIVCLADVDLPHPQLKPLRIHEDLLLRKDYVRPPPQNFSYVNVGTILPSAPRNLIAYNDPFSGGVTLTWDGPDIIGDATILGTAIYRVGQPADTSPILINSNDNSLASYYLDITANVNNPYIYQVALVTSSGNSPLSNLAYYPINLFDEPTNDFVILTGDLNWITTGDGSPILSSGLN